MKEIIICRSCGLEVAVVPQSGSAALCPRCGSAVGATRGASGPATGVVLEPMGESAAAIGNLTLAPGSHTLGRKSPKSTASVQIDIQDFFMSKLHTGLDISGQPGNTVVKARDAGSSNGTFVNERRLMAGETTELFSGDSLRLGNTVFKVRII